MTYLEFMVVAIICLFIFFDVTAVAFYNNERMKNEEAEAELFCDMGGNDGK